MRHVERINVGQAADMLEASTVTEVIIGGGMRATTLTLEGEKVVLIQASGEDFLLVR